jgi:uncharacterized protein YndB with AHSA1/START domain
MQTGMPTGILPVVIKRILPCTKRQLFEAWSKPALMVRWHIASQQPKAPSTVNNSFTVGGAFEVVMHLQTGDYRHYGEYQAIERYSHIAFSWSSHIVQNSLVALDFKELSPNRTLLTLTHSQLPDEAVRGKHTEGWTRCLQNLEPLLLWLVEQAKDNSEL